MGNLKKDVDHILKDMRDAKSKSSDATAKGSFGERAVLKILENYYQRNGGILIHSYSYTVDKTQPGNIKINESGKPYFENLGSTTEIDVLYVSKFRVFPIEIKAYKAKTITLTDGGISGCYKTDKSPVHQNEMHCRHLYGFLFRALQEGNTDFIVPIVCFVDEADIIDDRSDWQRSYVKLSILDTIEDLITECDTPLSHQLNLDLIDKLLKEHMSSNEKYFPVRY